MSWWLWFLLLLIIFAICCFIHSLFFKTTTTNQNFIKARKGDFKKLIKDLKIKIDNHEIKEGEISLISKMIVDPEVPLPVLTDFNIIYQQVIDSPKLETIEQKKESIYQFTDPQNVHDSVINTLIDQQYSALVQDIKGLQADYPLELLTETDPRVAQVIQTIKGEYKGLGTEKEIFDNVWTRACQVGAQQAFVDSLIDCVDEKNNVVCSSGKITRIMSSLAGIDPQYGQFANLDAIKMEVLTKAAHVASDFSDYEDPLYIKTITDTIHNDYGHLTYLVRQDLVRMVTNLSP